MDKPHQYRRTMAAENNDEDEAAIVERAVQTLYERLNAGASASTVASTKEVPAAGHRIQTSSNNGKNSAGDDYDDAAALAFLTAAVVEVNYGGAPAAVSPSSPAPANSSGSQNDGKFLRVAWLVLLCVLDLTCVSSVHRYSTILLLLLDGRSGLRCPGDHTGCRGVPTVAFPRRRQEENCRRSDDIGRCRVVDCHQWMRRRRRERWR